MRLSSVLTAMAVSLAVQPKEDELSQKAKMSSMRQVMEDTRTMVWYSIAGWFLRVHG